MTSHCFMRCCLYIFLRYGFQEYCDKFSKIVVNAYSSGAFGLNIIWKVTVLLHVFMTLSLFIVTIMLSWAMNFILFGFVFCMLHQLLLLTLRIRTKLISCTLKCSVYLFCDLFEWFFNVVDVNRRPSGFLLKNSL